MGQPRQVLLLCFAALLLSTALAIVDPELNRRCQAQGTCSECIQESPDCGWCSEASPAVGERRCNAIDRSNPGSNTCSIELEDPPSVLVSRNDVELEGLNQVTPQRAAVEVRPGSPVTFEVQVQPANNFPIDLYLLMDLSFSMDDDLDNLKRLGTSLAERIESISNNFTLGFGSFVDKRRGSFVSLDPRRLRDPCNDGCEAPYSFRHVVSLTKDADLFSTRVNEQVISGNQDFPEGGFDGFLQAIVCTNVIGWRPVSRKIILYISDAGFHYAGDGLLGGIIKPNDGKCHMGPEEATTHDDGTIEYNLWERLDYPSIGQIAEKLDEFDIIPIFAVVERFQDLYSVLQNELGNRAFLGELDRDSRNVVDLVERLYDEISTSVAFSPVNIPGISVTTTITSCPVPIDGVCMNVMSGQTVTFNVSVDVIECTPELAASKEIELRVVGFGTVIVDVSAICECGCESQRVPDSAQCTDRGTLVCGLCECNQGYFGETCQCDSTGTTMDGDVECPTGPNGLVCSGRGTCTCGICDCRTDTTGAERFYGLACECDNTVCERGTGNEICSGPSQGECTCDGCRCLPEPITGQLYTMSDCSCTPNTQTCVDPSNSNDICNGRGRCECGQCICDPNSPYFGDFCEQCSGDQVCQLQTCAAGGDNALCASCVVDILIMLNEVNITDELFTERVLQDAISNGTLPENSTLSRVTYGDGLMVVAIFLPDEFSEQCSTSVNVTCPRFVVVNQTFEMEYEIDGRRAVRCTAQGQGCSYPYFVSVDEMGVVLPIHVEYPPSCPVVEETRGQSGFSLAIPPWAIALILIGLLLLLGIIALILLKVLLMILDYIELKKFEKELEKIKYTKNENPLYHAATTEHKNPIYGQ